MAATDVLPEVEKELSDFDNHSHYVRIPALLAGGPVVALCGKKYIPTILGAAVLDLPVCPTCKDLHNLLKSMG